MVCLPFKNCYEKNNSMYITKLQRNVIHFTVDSKITFEIYTAIDKSIYNLCCHLY